MIHKGMFSLAVLKRHGTCCRQAKKAVRFFACPLNMTGYCLTQMTALGQKALSRYVKR